jgi:uncharacterized protein involved in exopolysaccharide biosynthesis
MSEWNTASPASGVGPNEESAGFFDLMIVLAKYKKLIFGLPLLTAIVAAIVTFVLPEMFKATTRLLPPQQAQSGASALLSQLGGVAGIAAGVGALKNPNDLYVGMLKSRTVADELIRKFELKTIYNTASQEKARKTLEANTAVSSGKDGLISIEVEAGEPKLAANMANGYVEELLRLTRVLAVTEASQRRTFFERQLEMSKDNLVKAEIALKGALDTRGVISVDSESKALVETGARLKAQVSAKEIQLNSMKAFVTAANPEYRRIEEELGSLRGEVFKLENGRAAVAGADQSAGRKSGFENIKLLRDVKYYQMLYELLAKQYEVARLDEAKEPSIIQVLDGAVVPERAFKPRRTLIVFLSALVALVLGMFAAFIWEAKERALAAPASARKWNEFNSYLRFKR